MLRVLTTVLVIILAVILLTPSDTMADSSHLRVLFHGISRPLTRFNNGSELSLSGWVVAPDITSNSNKFLAIVGPRFDENAWWVELNIGGKIENGTNAPLIDVRASYNRFDPITFWANTQWINFDQGRVDELYTYAEINFWLKPDVIAIGVETENLFSDGKPDDLSAGAHLTAVLGSMTLVFAHQAHRRSEYQNWIFCTFDF